MLGISLKNIMPNSSVKKKTGTFFAGNAAKNDEKENKLIFQVLKKYSRLLRGRQVISRRKYVMYIVSKLHTTSSFD